MIVYIMAILLGLYVGGDIPAHKQTLRKNKWYVQVGLLCAVQEKYH